MKVGIPCWQSVAGALGAESSLYSILRSTVQRRIIQHHPHNWLRSPKFILETAIQHKNYATHTP